MKTLLPRFIILSLGTLLITGMIILIIRFYGLSQNFKSFDNGFFVGPIPYKIVPWEQSFHLEKDPALILWVDIYRAEDQTLITKPKNLAVIELLRQFSTTRFIFNIVDNVENIQKQLVALVDSEKADKRILIQSDFPAIISSVREIKPMMVFGSSSRDLVKLKIMEALWVLPAAPFNGDVLILPLRAKKYQTISKKLVMEMKRRYKKVILGPLLNKSDVDTAKSLEVDGLYVADPQLLF